MLDYLAGLDTGAKVLLTLAAVCTVLAGFARWARPHVHRIRARWTAFETAVVGREAIIHPESGRELAPAQPGIGTRQANIEQQVEALARQAGALAEAVAQIADSHTQIAEVREAQIQLDRRVTAIEQGHFFERMAGKAEAIQLYSTIEAVAKADPPDDAD